MAVITLKDSSNKSNENKSDNSDSTADSSMKSNFSKYVLIRRNYDGVDDFMEVRVAVVGNVDAGKSTLLGVLTHGILGRFYLFAIRILIHIIKFLIMNI